MNISLAWKTEYFEVVIALATVTIGFIGYFFISQSKSLPDKFIKKFGKERTLILWVLFQRLSGVFWLGLIPIVITLTVLSSNLTKYGILIVNTSQTLLWILLISALIIPMNLIFGKNSENLKKYPQIRAREWNVTLLLVNALSWMAYLFAYEYLFRGLLLFSSVRLFGAWPAIAVNAAIYTIVHFHKGMKETIAAIPFGVVLCVLTFYTQTIWAAFFAHVVLALSNEWIALAANPEMSLA